MTTYSKQELRDSALEEIKVKDAGEDVPSLDSDMVDDELQRLIEAMNDEGLLIFDPSSAITTSNIPGRIFNALRDMLAETIAPKYDRPTRTVVGPGGRQESMYENAMRRLRRAVLLGSDDTPVKAKFF